MLAEKEDVMKNKPGYKLVQYRPKDEEPAGYTKEDAEYVMSQLMEQAPLSETELRNFLWNALVQIVEGFEKPTPRSAAKTFMEAYPTQPELSPAVTKHIHKEFPQFAQRIRKGDEEEFPQSKPYPKTATQELIEQAEEARRMEARAAERAQLRAAILRDKDAVDNKISMVPGAVHFMDTYEEIKVKATPGEDKPTVGNTPGERGPYGYDK